MRYCGRRIRLRRSKRTLAGARGAARRPIVELRRDDHVDYVAFRTVSDADAVTVSKSSVRG